MVDRLFDIEYSMAMAFFRMPKNTRDKEDLMIHYKLKHSDGVGILYKGKCIGSDQAS